jgi:hypothetical protein
MSTQEEFDKMSDSEKKKEDWMNSKWRPMMGWLYMAVCAFDFVLFPILWSMLQAIMKVGTMTQWQPLTLQGAGLFHIAMGAVLGIAAMGRTQEKLAGANNGGATSTAPTGFSVPPATSGGFQAPAASSGFSSPSTAGGFGSSSFGSTPSPTPAAGGFGGGFGNAGAITTTASGKKIVPTGDEPVL